MPLTLPVIPVGFVLGLLVNGTDLVSGPAGIASAPLIMGGASQLAAISLLATGAGVVPVVATVAIINARHIMYSARLRIWFQQFPPWFRFVGSYVLLDQVYALTELAIAEDDGTPTVGERMARYLGSGITLAGTWIVVVALGVLVGQTVPAGWSLDFSVPLLFLGLLILSIRNGPGIVAAVVGGVVATAAAGLPSGSGLLLGALGGITAAAVSERWLPTGPEADDGSRGAQTPDRGDDVAPDGGRER